jgi:DNA sulfur modification protein DndD
MKFNTLKLVNWGPYVDEHIIDLSVTDNAPVVVFYAENGHGKTSILTALKWCLYGKTIYKNDGRTVRSLDSLINLESLQGGSEIPFEVSINIEHRGEEFELTRAGRASQAIDGTVKLSNMSVTLKPKDGPPFAQQDIEERINAILNEEVSEFFLFDGEMLGRFEERLKETDTSRIFVRKQVERALGLPFIETLLGDFDAVEAQANKIIEASNRKNKKTEQARLDFAAKNERLEGVGNDIVKVSAIRDGLNDEIDGLQEQLEKVEPIRELLLDQQSTEKQLAEAESDLTDVEDQLKGLLEDAWWFPLEETLRGENDTLQTAWETSKDSDTRRIELDYQIKNLRNQLNSDKCLNCGQKLPDHDEAHIHEEISTLEGELAKLPESSQSEDLLDRIRKLRAFANRASTTERIEALELDIRRAKVRMDKDKQRLRNIQEQLSGDRIDVAALDSQLRGKKLDRDKATQVLDGLEISRKKLRDEIGEISKTLRNSPDVDSKDRELLNLADAAEEVIRQAFASFRDEMRGRVEEQASELFRRLSTEKEYESVRIGPDYSLKVLTSDRRTDNATVELSAGFNQVLTVSFIGALGECSVEEAPLVMDTPFSRLDVGHRRAILDWVSEYRPQVILFTHSGEMVRATDREHLHGSIAREYTIQRLNAFSSTVRKVQNV